MRQSASRRMDFLRMSVLMECRKASIWGPEEDLEREKMKGVKIF